MAVSVKKVTLWRKEIDDRPGSLARVLEPLAGAGANLQVAMGYKYPNPEGRAVVEVSPVTGRRVTAAAQGAGLGPSDIPAILVQGDDRQGLGHALTSAFAGAGINLNFMVALVVGPRYSAVFGFDSDEDASRAVPLAKAAGRAPKKRARPASRRKAARRGK
jgi:hypothetical protein